MNQVKIPSYGKVYAVGHAALGEGFFDGELIVEEKIDGSQFSFGVIEGKLCVRSNNREFDPYAPDNMFAEAAQTAIDLFEADKLPEGTVFRGEYLKSPKQNVLTYDRIPKNHIILFDVFSVRSMERHWKHDTREWAAHLGLECVPRLGVVTKPTFDDLKEFLKLESVLGGQTLEGVVLKPAIRLWGRDGKQLNGKYVSEAFKEKHSRETYGAARKKDVLLELAETYRTEARWQKAHQHLMEDGLLEGKPRDIGKLIPEVIRDTLEECEEEIKDYIWNKYKKDFTRLLSRGLPEWYKEKIAREQIG